MCRITKGGIAYADNIDNFFRGDEGDDNLLLDYGIAKRIEIDKEKEIDVILELRREHQIDNFRTADYTIRTTIEF
ncbi:hypothetical protein LCGC14_0544420 [marine sediment metagenome]|uniref:Uncharacterized protein n=1 Tax=marine sediment metagenome TaxID=412755 RepID=A0A0F9RRW0_9ZZZZ